MSSESERMEKALMDRLEPELRRRRFAGSFPHFRRHTPSKTDLLSVHFERNRGSFLVEIGEVPPSDFDSPIGVRVEIGKATSVDALSTDRARLAPTPASSAFRFRRSVFDWSDTRFDRAAEKVVELLPQADRWWAGDRLQQNVQAG